MNNNIIINEPCSVIRSIARKELKGSWIMVTLGVGLYYLLINVIPDFFNTFVPLARQTVYNEALKQNVTVSYIASLYEVFFIGVFTIGLSCFFIAFFRKKDINVGYLFDGFEYYLKAFALMFMVGLFIFLWSLLLIVPGIIAAFRYSQAFYIMADDPSKGVMQCIEESKFMMMGNKEKYFLLNLSFIGWAILASIPLSIFSDKTIFPNDTVSFILSIFAAIPYCFCVTYIMTADVAFYDLLTGHLKAKPAFNEADYHFVEPKQLDNTEGGMSENEKPESVEKPAENIRDDKNDDDGVPY